MRAKVAMPLDTGAVTQNLLRSAGVDLHQVDDPSTTAIEGALSIGAALRATRQRSGRSLQDLSDSTRIKRAYLEALEEMRLEDLPSRPFTIGYVRAYARALDLDAEAAVLRFKQDVPGDTEPLRAPVGVRKHSDVRIALLAGGGAVVVSAVLLWNLARHSMAEETPPPAVVPESAQPGPAASATPSTVTVSAAQPAPQESTLPTPYVTPGLGPDGATSPSATGVYDGAIDPKALPTFTAHGAVYGAAAGASLVTLQARKSVSIVVRTPEQKVVYAGVLQPGEAYRAPTTGDLSADVSDPQDINVYVGGQIHAGLTAQVTPFSKLAADAKPAALAGSASTAPATAAR
ncbi:MAG TPA: helix-turn-helix domain-containing protein [Caulobacteraceae bacterium]